LRLAACIGNKFDLETLAVVFEKSQSETAFSLREAVSEGLIIEARNLKPKIEGTDVEIHSANFLFRITSFKYKFSHDRIQQAAYSLIPDAKKQSVHLKIGEILLQNTPREGREEKIIEIVDQLNLGIASMKKKSARDELARLNLTAGKRAKASAAHKMAIQYLETGISLLDEKSWVNEYELSFQLHTEAAYCAFLMGEFKKTDKLLQFTLQHAQTVTDTAKVHEIKIRADNAQNNLREAVRKGIFVLKILGMNLPENPGKSNILLSLISIRLSMLGHKIENLVDLPEMTDPGRLAMMHICAVFGNAAYLSNPKLVPIMCTKSIEEMLKYGNTPEAAFIYATYGLILCSLTGDIESGYRFGKVSLKILERFNALETDIQHPYLEISP